MTDTRTSDDRSAPFPTDRSDADDTLRDAPSGADDRRAAALAPGPIGVVREIERDETNVRELILAFAALLILFAVIPFVARAAGAWWLLLYALAVGAWWRMVGAWSPASLEHVLLGAGALHLPLLLQSPLAGAVPAAEGPVGALLAGGLAASGMPVLAGRALAILATAGGAALLWRGGRPRRALGFATFPLLAIEGMLNARVEVVAAVLLFAAALLVRRNREGWSALSAFTSVGILVPAVTLLPALWDQAYHVAPFIGAALVVIIGMKLALPAENLWKGAFTAWIAASPSLSLAAEWLAMRLAMWGAADFLDDLSLRAQQRSGMTWAWRFDDEVMALLAVFAAVIMIATVAARRAKTPDETAADTLGATLLVSATLAPSMWLLVVPFAIAANRRLWILLALSAPVLYLARGHASPWVVYGVSLAIPAAWWLAIRVWSGAPAAEQPAAA